LILITHHVEEIVPEIGRVILLSRGRIAGDGPKREMLSEARLSEVFEGRMRVRQDDGYYHVQGGKMSLTEESC
jgi:iron complex transport system ATP-binding protein